MSDKPLKLTEKHIVFIMEQTGESNPRRAIEYFAQIMYKEGLRPRQMPEVVEKMMIKMENK